MRKAALAFIFVTVVLDVIAMGVVIPVLPTLVEGFLGGNTASAARVFGVFGTVWSLMQFVCSPLLGALSDRFGRRPVILLSNFGLGLDYDRRLPDLLRAVTRDEVHAVVYGDGGLLANLPKGAIIAVSSTTSPSAPAASPR